MSRVDDCQDAINVDNCSNSTSTVMHKFHVTYTAIHYLYTAGLYNQQLLHTIFRNFSCNICNKKEHCKAGDSFTVASTFRIKFQFLVRIF